MEIHRRARDLRTAQQRWDQMMAEAHSRGYLHDSGHQVDPELLTGWDHSKPKGTSKNAKKTDAEESAILLKSKGTIPLGIRDDTPGRFSFLVITFPPISEHHPGAVTTRRTEAAGLVGPRMLYTDLDIRNREDEMRGKNKALTKKLKDDRKELQEGFLDALGREGGPRWREWCHFDEEHLCMSYSQPRGGCTVVTGSIVGETTLEEGYVRAWEQMEIMAADQGTRSYTQLMRASPILEQEALEKRYFNYCEAISDKFSHNERSRVLTDPWRPERKTGWNLGCQRPFQLSHLMGEFIWPHSGENWLFFVLQEEWEAWCLAMSQLVTKYREEQQTKSVSGHLPIASPLQTPPIPWQSQSTWPFPSTDQLSRFQGPVEPSANGRHQGFGLGSIGSGRRFPQRSNTLDAFKGYQIWK